MPPCMEGVVVRQARRDDVGCILQLIRELAQFERQPDAVEATLESLLANLAFVSSPSDPTQTSDAISASRPARCLLLFTPSGSIAGMALYFYSYSTWRSKPGIWLEDLFVREDERGNGYGLRLLGELAKEVQQIEGGRLEWCVLKWNTPSIKFYESVGAIVMSEWQTMRLDREALANLAKKVG